MHESCRNHHSCIRDEFVVGNATQRSTDAAYDLTYDADTFPRQRENHLIGVSGAITEAHTCR